MKTLKVIDDNGAKSIVVEDVTQSPTTKEEVTIRQAYLQGEVVKMEAELKIIKDVLKLV